MSIQLATVLLLALIALTICILTARDEYTSYEQLDEYCNPTKIRLTWVEDSHPYDYQTIECEASELSVALNRNPIISKRIQDGQAWIAFIYPPEAFQRKPHHKTSKPATTPVQEQTT